ncbi:MAG TPA: hypothetical protein DGG95_10690, partial [Cytophagales bacterium]|nr:hypothetical protein [Cytophagales bacterium]
EVVAVQQKVKVTVTEVDIARKRIALSMKSDPFGGGISRDKSEATSSKPKAISRPIAREESMEEKLALLKSKFKK